jgi:hypothetical protein
VPSPSALADLEAAELDLLRLYEAMGIVAMTIKLVDGQIVVRCQNSGDVEPICRRVVDEHEAPAERTLN